MTKAERNVIGVCGDAQAKGIAIVLRQLAPIASAYEVAHFNDAPPRRLAECAFFLEQYGSKASDARRLPRTCKRITFPHLRFGLLWPLACGNPYNRADADNPIGPFPIGNSFVLSALERGVPAEEILGLLLAPAWNTSWPNLDMLFKSETAALVAADAKCDVKIGSFALKNFRNARLFWAQSAPSNALLGELTYRLLHACFGRETPVDRDAIRAAFAALSARELMGHVAVPVHPLVAEHFKLEWYAREERYPYAFGARSFEEYYRSMIEYIRSQRASLASRS